MKQGATVAVGYDGSAGAARALTWAVRAAAGHAATVRVIACYTLSPAAEPWFGCAASNLSTVAADAERRVDAAIDALRCRPADVTIEQHTSFGAPAQCLAEEALGGDLLVVGTSGHRGFDAWRLGSVAHAVVRHAPCPVVLVPDVEPPSSPHGRIVVGVDRSPASCAALQWACDEADDRHVELSVVHVWSYPYASDLDSPVARDLTRVDASLELEASVRIARQSCQGPVNDILVEGSPASELVVQSGHADLVVLGTRGNSPVRATLFGSLSQAVGARASCPTVIVGAAAH